MQLHAIVRLRPHSACTPNLLKRKHPKPLNWKSKTLNCSCSYLKAKKRGWFIGAKEADELRKQKQTVSPKGSKYHKLRKEANRGNSGSKTIQASIFFEFSFLLVVIVIFHKVLLSHSITHAIRMI